MSEKRAGTPVKFFKIEAESIVFVGADQIILTIVLFKPKKSTLERLRECSQAQDLGAIQMIDKWDDGTDDIHESLRNHKFVSLSGSGSGVKTSAYTLILMTS